MKKMFNCLAVVAALSLPVLMIGCSGNTSSGDGNRTETVFGRVIDSSTQNAIVSVAGQVKVKVELLDNGVKRETTTALNGTDADLAGTFSFDGVPAGNHTIKVTITDDPAAPATAKSLYAVKRIALSGIANAGDVLMNRGFDASFYVTSKSAPVAGVVVTAADGSGLKSSATTDANGKVTLSGLDQLAAYTISTAPKFNTDGTLQYVATSIPYNYTAALGAVSQINIDPLTRSTAIAKISSNLFNFVTDPANANLGASGTGAADPTNYLTSTSGDIKVVFNLPVTLDAANLTISFFDDQKAGPASATVLFNNKLVTPASAATLTSDGTILTIPAPAGGYTALETYTIQGGVTAAVKAGIDQATWVGTLNFTVTDTTIAAADPIIDNFNSAKNGTINTAGAPAVNLAPPAGTAQTAFLVFNEPVYGTVRVIGTQLANATAETLLNGTQIRINGLASGAIVFAPFPNSAVASAALNTAAGTSPGSVYRFDLGLGLVQDDNLGAANKIHLYVDVVDTHGNKIQKELTLGVL